MWPAKLERDVAAFGAVGVKLGHAAHDSEGGLNLRTPIGSESMMGVLSEAVNGD
jgi:hypothetical protein